MTTSRFRMAAWAAVLLWGALTQAAESSRASDPIGAYLGQTPPGAEAVIFAPGVVSVEGRYEYALSIAPDGRRLLFTVEVPDEGASVHGVRFEDGGWTEPDLVNLTGGARKNEMEAFFSPDGSRIFFAPFDEGMDVRIWTADVTAGGFADPRPLGAPVSEAPAFYPVQAADDGSLTYTNLAARAVFRATLEGDRVVSAEPAGLPSGGHAFPAPDGRYTVFDSASLDSEGQRDIFVTFRTADGTWGPAIPLGPEVNTEHSETCPSLSPDGRYLFFSRYNEPGRLSNIYWVSSEVIVAASPAAVAAR